MLLNSGPDRYSLRGEFLPLGLALVHYEGEHFCFIAANIVMPNNSMPVALNYKTATSAKWAVYQHINFLGVLLHGPNPRPILCMTLGAYNQYAISIVLTIPVGKQF